MAFFRSATDSMARLGNDVDLALLPAPPLADITDDTEPVLDVLASAGDDAAEDEEGVRGRDGGTPPPPEDDVRAMPFPTRGGAPAVFAPPAPAPPAPFDPTSAPPVRPSPGPALRDIDPPPPPPPPPLAPPSASHRPSRSVP